MARPEPHLGRLQYGSEPDSTSSEEGARPSAPPQRGPWLSCAVGAHTILVVSDTALTSSGSPLFKAHLWGACRPSPIATGQQRRHNLCKSMGHGS